MSVRWRRRWILRPESRVAQLYRRHHRLELQAFTQCLCAELSERPIERLVRRHITEPQVRVLVQVTEHCREWNDENNEDDAAECDDGDDSDCDDDPIAGGVI